MNEFFAKKSNNKTNYREFKRKLKYLPGYNSGRAVKLLNHLGLAF